MDYKGILDMLLSSLPPRPISKETIERLVVGTGVTTELKAQSSRAEWEYLFKNEIVLIADTEGAALKDPHTKYYDKIHSLLDIALAFSELEVCDVQFSIGLLEDLFDMQTIASCVHTFDWLDLRRKRVRVVTNAKSLVLLRTLNQLLKRVSRTGNATSFCGRILNLLSGMYGIGEKSGVNLRGEYGLPWGNPIGEVVKEELEKLRVLREEIAAASATAAAAAAAIESDAIADGEPSTSKVDAERKPKEELKVEKTEAERKLEFYDKFWSLQAPFSQPTLLAQPGTFLNFKATVETLLPVMSEASKKERLQLGTKGTIGAKRKRGDLDWETNVAASGSQQEEMEYFFAKYLTSPDLLDLELADTHFRRQVLFQLLILLHHLQNFTATEKQKWYTIRNRWLQMDFTLEEEDLKWVKDIWAKVLEELKGTAPNGRTFFESISVMLEREKGWVRWKNELCPPFDKPPLDEKDEEDARAKRQKILEPPAAFPHDLGTADLTSVWEMGYRDLRDLEYPKGAMDIKAVLSDIKRLDKIAELEYRRAAMRARAAAKAETSTPEPTAPSPSKDIVIEPSTGPSNGHVKLSADLPPKPHASSTSHPILNGAPPTNVVAAAPDPIPAAVDPNADKKRFHTWRGLRLAAQGGYLHLFGKIGSGNLEALVDEINKPSPSKGKPSSEVSVTAKADTNAATAGKGSESEGDVVKTEENVISKEVSLPPETDETMAPAVTAEVDVEAEVEARKEEGKVEETLMEVDT